MKHSLFLRICQAACLLAFFFLLTHSSMILAYAKAGLSSWACSVLPVLLPFIILSKFWIYYDIPQLFYSVAGRALPSHRQAALCITVLLLGLSSGFPVGAIFVQHYYKEGILPKRAAEELLPLCSFISPMFLLGYVHPLTGYHGITWILFVLSLYLPLFVCFPGVLRKTADHTENKKYRHAVTGRKAALTEMPKTARPSSLRDIWLSSLEIIFTIGIYMMLFSILFGLTLHEPLLHHTAAQIVLSNLEITTGIAWLSEMSALSGTVRGAVMATAVSLGGLCTMAQVYSTTFSSDFSMRRYLFIKGKCAFLSALLFFLLAENVPG